MDNARRGFTLLELSVVIAIIALLIGGVMVGSDMLRSARIQSIIGDIGKYEGAVQSFRTKYMALPGDFTGATALWGADAGCPGTPYTTVLHTATCNGNGDGGIQINYEMFRAWQQLSNAGLIDGTFSGVAGPLNFADHVPGVNVPAVAIKGGGFEILTLTNVDSRFFPGLYNTILQVGRVVPTGGGVDDQLFTPPEAKIIDDKLDDGLPGQGRIRPFTPNELPDCTTSVDPLLSLYQTHTNIACQIWRIISFD